MRLTRSLWAPSLLVAAAAFGAAPAAAQVNEIVGAGATFPYPVYAKWAEAYKAQSGKSMNYQSIGSGGGIKQIQARTVDFGASDMPLKPEDLKQHGVMQFPAIIGGVVPIVNLDGVAPGQLKLTGQLLADIYLGKIKQWDDAALASANPGVKLPGGAITVVRRSDGSGTSFLFTDYLAKLSPEWKDKVGAGTSVNWPAGVGGKGNEGVAAYVQRIKGSIGYVEYAYAKRNKMAHVMLRNRDGSWVNPDDETFAAAAANAEWERAPGFGEVLTEQAGKTAWPITGASFVLVHTEPKDPARTLEVLKFFDWAFKNGQQMATELDYVPMPQKVTTLVEQAWRSQIRSEGAPVWK